MAKLTFYINESVNVAVGEGLKRRGVKVISARDADNLGLSDKEQRLNKKVKIALGYCGTKRHRKPCGISISK